MVFFTNIYLLSAHVFYIYTIGITSYGIIMAQMTLVVNIFVL